MARENACSDDEAEENPDAPPPKVEEKKDDGEEDEVDHEKIQQEYEEDIRNGDLTIILSKLEVIGKKKSIYLYKEMVELRDKRNEKVHKYLGVWDNG